jgi:hypothetical protein
MLKSSPLLLLERHDIIQRGSVSSSSPRTAGPGCVEKKHRVELWAAGTMIAGRTCVLIAFALALTGCASIQETPFAPNMVRLDVKPYAAPFIREAMLRRAAELTLQNGYSAFRVVPIYVQAFDDFGVTVVMFHAGANDTFDAAAVLRKYGD